MAFSPLACLFGCHGVLVLVAAAAAPHGSWAPLSCSLFRLAFRTRFAQEVLHFLVTSSAVYPHVDWLQVFAAASYVVDPALSFGLRAALGGFYPAGLEVQVPARVLLGSRAHRVSLP